MGNAKVYFVTAKVNNPNMKRKSFRELNHLYMGDRYHISSCIKELLFEEYLHTNGMVVELTVTHEKATNVELSPTNTEIEGKS